MKTVETSIEISATPERVWHVLTQDLPASPNDFGLLQFEGQITPNARIKLRAEVAPKQVFALTVSTFDPPHRMVWTGGMPLGLFTGTRSFTVSETSHGCRFEMSETFTGPLAGLITRSMPDLAHSFEKFAHALKEKAEQI